MATKEIPSRQRQAVVVEWIYVQTRTLVLLGGIALGAIGWGVYWWYSHGRDTDIRDQARQAVADAERAVADATARAPQAPDLKLARVSLERAQRELESQEFGRSVEDAHEAEKRAASATAPDAAETETGARLARVSGEAHLKRAGQFVWEPISDKTVLRAGDQIRTAADSTAEVVYFDGTRVTVAGSSMLEIRELFRDTSSREQRVKERLAWGSLNASTTENEGMTSVHEVSTDEASFKSRKAADFQVSRAKDSGRSEITTYSGSVAMQTGGREVEVPESTQVTVAEGRIIDKVQLVDPPRLTSPPDQKSFAAPSESKLTLVWAPESRADRYRLQVSTSGNFSPVQVDLQLGGTQADLPELLPGMYFWRLASIDHDGRAGRWSESRKFRILGTEYRDLDDRTPPPLQVTEVLVVGTNAIVSGNTEPGALVWIDGERVDVGDSGKFTWVVKLREDGLNKIQLLAQDAAGNETRKLTHAQVDVF
ncbi:MAG: FecR domain-containing protein [Acidobacteriota bacterium]